MQEAALMQATVEPLPARDAKCVDERARVLVVARYPVGGIRTHLRYVYPALDRAGYRFTFVVPDDPALSVLKNTLSDLQNAEYVGVPSQGGRCRLWPMVRRLARSGRFAAVHSHGFTAAIHGVLGTLGLRLPHLATIHDVVRPEQFPGLWGRCKRWALGRLLRRIDTILPVGHDVRANLLEHLVSLRGRAERLVTIPNGVPIPPEDEPADVDVRQRLGIDPGTAVLGFLGRFMEQKGFLPLLAALELVRREGCPPFVLLAIGSGDHERAYWSEVERRGLAACVRMLPFTPDVQPLLRSLDLLVVPSLWEALPLLPMEAMVAGVPVLGTDCIGLREVLAETPSRMVRTGDPAALAAGLREALRRPWTDAAREFVPEARRRFDCRTQARRLLDVFEATVAGRR
jgi:glycosyltransferase involved in cell wall biosynthesis